jgi:uncharacterized protein involved in outer membrane biogenesis
MPRSIKIIVATVVVPLVLVAGLLFAIPYFVNVDAFGGKVVQQIEATLGRKVTVGAIHLSLMPPSLVIEKLAISEDPKFGSGDFATVDSLKVRVSLMALFNRNLDVSSIQAERPSIKLIKNAQGVMNIDSLAGGAAGKNAPGGAAAAGPPLEIGKLQLTDGTVVMDDLSGPKASHQKFEHVKATVGNFSSSTPFDFLVSLNVGEGTIETSGTAGPIQQGDPSMLPLKSQLKLDKVDLGQLAGPDLQGLLSGIVDIDDDGKVAKVDGSTTVEKLVASPKGRAAAVPVLAKFQVEYTFTSEVLAMKNVTINVGQSQGQLSGMLNRKNPALSRINLKAENAALVEIGKLLPALGVILPNNSSFASGVLSNAGEFHGSLQPLNGQATLNVQNAKLTGFSVSDKVATVAKLAGIQTGGKDTEIQSLKGAANFVNGAATFSNLVMVIPGVTISGGGSMSPDGHLDMKMQALLTSAAAGAQIMNILSAGKPVPFFVRGTMDNPTFLPDVAGMAKNQVSGITGTASGAEKALSGLFGKKKN